MSASTFSVHPGNSSGWERGTKTKEMGFSLALNTPKLLSINFGHMGEWRFCTERLTVMPRSEIP